jgi:hypothetical protein
MLTAVDYDDIVSILSFQYDFRSVITQTIGNLKHGRGYIVQATVTKSRGSTLSYDLLQVQTKPVCT